MSMRTKILVTGVGRCGTSAFMALLTELGFSTGFNQEYVRQFVEHDRDAAFEHPDIYNDHYIVKIPHVDIDEFDKNYHVNNVIILTRDRDKAVKSRLDLAHRMGLSDKTLEHYYKYNDSFLLKLFDYCINKQAERNKTFAYLLRYPDFAKCYYDPLMQRLMKELFNNASYPEKAHHKIFVKDRISEG